MLSFLNRIQILNFQIMNFKFGRIFGDGKIDPLENAEKDAGGNFWSSLGMPPGYDWSDEGS